MKLNVLISIKPKYVQQILSGNKKFEYRKRIFKKEIDKVYIYSTSPEQKIVGYFQYSGYLSESPEKVWDITNNYSGIGKKEYFEYFKKSSYAYAIKIEQIYEFENPINPKEKFEKFIPPQSYCYLEGDIY